MTTPSKLGAVFMSVFGLPFLGMGLFAAYRFLNAANQPLAARIGAAVFASVFAMIGGGIIFGSLYGYSLQKEQARRESANPTSPWLWRQDWAASRVESKNRSSAIGWWVAAVLVNMLLLPLSVGSISKGLSMQDPIYIIPATVELIGLLVLFGAIRATSRFKRFGKTYFEMASLPFSPGSRVAGAIHVHLDRDVHHGVDLTLCDFQHLRAGRLMAHLCRHLQSSSDPVFRRLSTFADSLVAADLIVGNRDGATK
ncbi:MAG: hypothetical protein WCC21_06855 [Candidatus Acidiferrales bacterium]